MRVLSVSLMNFASYEKLEFDFTEQGLTLIQGPTGAGKSTLCDAIPWVLFGKTAKGGAVDEVRPWGSNDLTSGKLLIDNTLVARSRKPNDLYFIIDGQTPIRGKDLADTQRMLNEHLGLTYETYLTGAYYHEFSPTAGFFTATAKSRRALIEQLVDLSLATQLQTELSDQAKELTKQQYTARTELASVDKMIAYLHKQTAANQLLADKWESDRQEQLQVLKAKAEMFSLWKEENIQKTEAAIKTLPPEEDINEIRAQHTDLTALLAATSKERCETCGAGVAHKHVDEIKEALHLVKMQLQQHKACESHRLLLERELANAKAETNDTAERLKELENSQNPYAATSSDTLTSLQAEKTAFTTQLTDITAKLTDFELLTDIIAEYKVSTIKNTVQELQERTNRFLTDHFDAEIQVRFEPGPDKIETTILKDGNECVFTQLSKGQRQLLKLCFGLTAMTVASNHSGVQYNALFLDEAFDGLDENLKVKAYRLLESLALEHESVFVVEHSEALKTRFNKKYTVSLNNGVSSIEDA